MLSPGGVERSWGCACHRLHLASRKVGGRLMTEARWTVLVETKRTDGGTERIEIASLERDVSSPTPDDLGLRLAEANELPLRLQSLLAQDHVRRVSAVDRTCCCRSRRRLHDYRTQTGRYRREPADLSELATNPRGPRRRGSRNRTLSRQYAVRAFSFDETIPMRLPFSSRSGSPELPGAFGSG